MTFQPFRPSLPCTLRGPLAVLALLSMLRPSPALAQGPRPDAADAAVARSADTRAESDGAQARPAGRPVIGVAFGGGAAKGFAHIGVLRWFDEHRIPVDVAAGTSMGGLIGGAFAVGLSPDEVQEFAAAIDWDLVFLGDTPFKYKFWRRKEDARRFPSQIEFGLRKGIVAPTGLNSGRAVDQVIDGLVLPYSRITSFDQLPTPMRMVAADTKTAEVVVLKDGSLSNAMRATMSLPGIFPPVRIGDMLLIDGGTLNNVPADVVRQMGADVVIAVDVGGGAEMAEDAAKRAESVPTLFGVMGSAIDTMMRSGTARALKEADLMIVPKILPYGSLSWTFSRELAARGYEAAEARKDDLLKYQVDEATYAAWKSRREAKRLRNTVTPAFVDVVGGEPSRMVLIDEALEGIAGVPFDPQTLTVALQKLAGTDRYETLRYGFVEKDGQVGLQIQLVQKPWGPPFLEFGFEMNNLSTSTFAADLRGRATFDGFLGGGSESRIDFGLGSNRLIEIENFRPLWRTPLFVAARGFWRKQPAYFVQDGEISTEYSNKRLGYALDVGTLIGNVAQIRVGYQQADVRISRRIGDPLSPERDGGEASFGVLMEVDTQTSPMVPTHGVLVRARLDRYLDTADLVLADGERFAEDDHFSRLDVTGSWFARAGTRGRMFVAGGAGTTFSARPFGPYNFALGGPFRLGALVPGTLFGSKYLQATGGYLREVGRLPSLLGGPVFLGGWYETGAAANDFKDADWHNNITSGMVMESILGPIFGAVSVDVEGGWRYYVSIGRLFR